MLLVSLCLFLRRDAVVLGHGTSAQLLVLRKHKPYPLTGFLTRSQFRQNFCIDRVLNVDESLEIVRIGHFTVARWLAASVTFTSGRRLTGLTGATTCQNWLGRWPMSAVRKGC
jgi:hypothetical protein